MHVEKYDKRSSSILKPNSVQLEKECFNYIKEWIFCSINFELYITYESFEY